MSYSIQYEDEFQQDLAELGEDFDPMELKALRMKYGLDVPEFTKEEEKYVTG